jgi:hypothetical protein
MLGFVRNDRGAAERAALLRPSNTIALLPSLKANAGSREGPRGAGGTFTGARSTDDFVFCGELTMGTGGMRFGAGRPGYRARAESLQRVDIRIWHRGGYLAAGRCFSWCWNRGGEPAGSIGVRAHGRDALTLEYMVGNEGARHDGSQSIRLAHTPCGFGGSRPWFLCPVCQRRSGVLFLRGGRFACRVCQRVAYASQSGDQIDALWRKQAKIEERLGEHWRRPKGMRLRTYERLFSAVLNCEERRDAALAVALSRLLGKSGAL